MDKAEEFAKYEDEVVYLHTLDEFGHDPKISCEITLNKDSCSVFPPYISMMVKEDGSIFDVFVEGCIEGYKNKLPKGKLISPETDEEKIMFKRLSSWYKSKNEFIPVAKAISLESESAASLGRVASKLMFDVNEWTIQGDFADRHRKHDLVNNWCKYIERNINQKHELKESCEKLVAVIGDFIRKSGQIPSRGELKELYRVTVKGLRRNSSDRDIENEYTLALRTTRLGFIFIFEGESPESLIDTG